MTTDEAAAAILELVAVNDRIVEVMESMADAALVQSLSINLLSKRVKALEEDAS